jgi:TonB family protein
MAALAEEACDAVVLAHGHDPRDYSRYLIDMARSVSSSGARIQVWGMAMPGGSLEERIRRILEGGPLPRLSRARLACACIACAATSAAFATSTLDHQRPAVQPDRKVVLAQPQATVPDKAVRNLILAQAQPQAPTFLPVPAAIPDAPGVTVSADRIMHRDAVEYPADALAKGIEGTVILNVVLAPDGTVSDAAVIGGPLELRRTVLSSVLKWHFSKEAAPRQQVSVEFKLSEAKAAAARDVRAMAPPPTAALSGSALTDVPRTLHVDIQGLSAEAAAELRQRLALQEGEVFDHAAFVKELERIHQIVSEFDPHLNDSRAVGKAARKTGADGKALPPDSMDVEVIIAPRDPAPQGELQQFAKIAEPPSLENVPIKLHVDIRGLSPEAAAELRRRLAVAEGETTDLEALKKTVARIRQVMKYFDPRLTDEMNFAFRSGADGEPRGSVAATLYIRLKP